MTSPEKKQDLRQLYRAVRRDIPSFEREWRSAAIADQVLALPEVERAQTCFIYLASKSEVQTRGLIEQLLELGKRVAVPRVLDEPGMMEAVVIDSLVDLKPGRFMIDEPSPEITTRLDAAPDLAIVPGLAFTATGMRLGQGGGYYDRYLAKHQSTLTLGLCFTEQLADTLPTDPHDITMNHVIAG